MPNRVKYQLIELTPLPMPTTYNIYIYFNLITTTIALSEDDLEYILINLQLCTRLHKEMYCPLINSITHTETHTCTTNILLAHTDEQCERKYFTTTSSLFIKLKNRLSWIIYPSRKELLNIRCADSESTMTITFTSI